MDCDNFSVDHFLILLIFIFILCYNIHQRNRRFLHLAGDMFDLRQDIIIEQLNSIIEFLGNSNDVAITENVHEEVIEGQVTFDKVAEESLDSLTKAEIIERLALNNIEVDERKKKAELLEILKSI